MGSSLCLTLDGKREALNVDYETCKQKYICVKKPQSPLKPFYFILDHSHCFMANQGQHILFVQFWLYWNL